MMINCGRILSLRPLECRSFKINLVLDQPSSQSILWNNLRFFSLSPTFRSRSRSVSLSKDSSLEQSKQRLTSQQYLFWSSSAQTGQYFRSFSKSAPPLHMMSIPKTVVSVHKISTRKKIYIERGNKLFCI